MIGGLGASLAAMAVSQVFANQETPVPNRYQSQKLQELTIKYPRPHFKVQIQTWPGLVSKMDPRPDHGKTS